jgi:GntR family transcriptional regulator of arabinose operon
LAAYNKIIELAGCKPHLTPIGDDEFYLEDLAQWAETIRRQSPSDRPTAVVCWNDMAAICLSRHLKDAGVSIPDDISIVGFDDSSGAPLQEPGLTSYHQPYEQISETAFNLANSQFKRETIEPRTRLLKGKLIIRGSAQMVQD